LSEAKMITLVLKGAFRAITVSVHDERNHIDRPGIPLSQSKSSPISARRSPTRVRRYAIRLAQHCVRTRVDVGESDTAEYRADALSVSRRCGKL
jgi:hypothetical protein